MKRALWALTGMYWLGLFILTHLPPAELPKVRFSDKFAHAAAYFVLAALLYGSLWTTKLSPARIAGLVLVIALLYGAIDEWTQPLVGRFCSMDDWLANAVGAIAAAALVGFARVVVRRRAP